MPAATVRLLPWVLRASWALLVVTAGGDLAGALDGRSTAVRTTATVGLWGAWAVVLCASLVLHPASLTIVRLGAPAAVAATAWATSVAGAGVAAITLVVAFLPEVGVAYVNGPAYANERRFPLRVPAPLLAGPLFVAAVVTVGGPVAGALLLAARQWIAGGAVLVVAAPAAVVLGRSLYGLARRWLVFVPAGVVVHDPMTLADPVLFRRQDVASFDLAPATTDALDLTARAAGIALQLDVREPVSLALVRSDELASTASLLVAPTRPGAVLREARARRLG